MRLGAIIGLVVMGGLFGQAQIGPQRLRLKINHSGSDVIGAHVADAAREAARQAAGYQLVTDGDPDYTIDVISIRTNCGGELSLSSAVAVIFLTREGHMFNAFAFSVGAARAEALGRSVITSFGEDLSRGK